MPLVFTISLLNANSEPMLNYLPIPFNLETVDETASAFLDYQYTVLNTSIPANTYSIKQTIPTIDDALNEYTETMQMAITLTSSGVSNPSPFVFGTGTIKDNDLPNLFSPNNDGNSDTFKIAGVEDYPNFKLTIIDRWGSEVFNYSNNR